MTERHRLVGPVDRLAYARVVLILGPTSDLSVCSSQR